MIKNSYYSLPHHTISKALTSQKNLTSDSRSCFCAASQLKVWDITVRKCALLLESLLTAALQSLLAECLYLKGLPEDGSHLAWYSDGSQIAAAGEVLEYFAASENKLHGLDRHGNWAGFERTK